MTNLLERRVLIQTAAQHFSHHRVFAHENFGVTAQGDPNLLHLVRAGSKCERRQSVPGGDDGRDMKVLIVKIVTVVMGW